MERPLTPDAPPDVAFRDAIEGDHAHLVHLVREWWDEHPPRLERLWLRHFAGTSVVGTSAAGRFVAAAIGFPSAGRPGRGVLWLVAVAPAQRRRGVGRAAAAAVVQRLGLTGARSVEAVVWPGNRAGVRFLEAIGFATAEESRGAQLYGVPAIADYDGDGEDRSVLERTLPTA